MHGDSFLVHLSLVICDEIVIIFIFDYVICQFTHPP